MRIVRDQTRNSTATVLTEADDICRRYRALLEQFAACRNLYSTCKKLTSDELDNFQSDVDNFMRTARRERVGRKLGHITSKLHLLEAHVPAAMKKFGVGLGLLAEQGGESIHAEFNSLQHRHGGIVNNLERLRVTVRQHLSSTMPNLVPLIPERATRKRSRED